MLHNVDDCAKRRLTDDDELRLAVEFLTARGVADDDMAVQLSRQYYIDVDVLNEVLAALKAADDDAVDLQQVA